MTPAGDFQPFQTTAFQVGTITQWVDDKGYGWVESVGKRFFTHIKDFEKGQRRPKQGEEVRFIAGVDVKGRTCAKRVVLVKGGKVRSGPGAWVVLFLLVGLPLLALLWLPGPWWRGAGWMLLASVIAYRMYAHDKQRAVNKGWRVAESSLHLAEILGGWPGAFLAQRRLRHKCSKLSYQAVFWMIVFLYQVAAVDVMLEQRLSRSVMAWMQSSYWDKG